MNPYDFVRVDLNKPPRLSKYAPHDRLIAGALHGRFEGTLTLLMPTFVKQPGQRQVGRNAQQFMRSNKHAIIPGSSLKGLFRSVVETVGGCW